MNHIMKIISFTGLIIILSACAASTPNRLNDYSAEDLRSGQGAVLIHAINNESLVATRWLKVDNPGVKRDFTVFPGRKRGFAGDRGQYDLIMVEPGTYAVYALHIDCPAGYRPYMLETDSRLKPEIATRLGMAVWRKRWNNYDTEGPAIGFGFIGGRSPYLGVGGWLPGRRAKPAEGSCYLLSDGTDEQGPLIASLTVNPGEIVYGGELSFNYLPNDNCRTSGNWMANNTLVQSCGAARLELTVADEFEKLAKPFIIKTLGPTEAQKALVRLAKPGRLANTVNDVN